MKINEAEICFHQQDNINCVVLGTFTLFDEEEDLMINYVEALERLLSLLN